MSGGPHIMDPVRGICIYCHCGGYPPTNECPGRDTAVPTAAPTKKDDGPLWSDRDGLLDRALAAESALAELRAAAETWARDMRDIENRGLAPRSWDIPLLEAIEARSP